MICFMIVMICLTILRTFYDLDDFPIVVTTLLTFKKTIFYYEFYSLLTVLTVCFTLFLNSFYLFTVLTSLGILAPLSIA